AALLALVVADALLAGRLLDLRVIVPADGEVGEPAPLRVLADLAGGRPGAVEAALALDPRLAPGGRLLLRLKPGDGAWQGAATLAPTRRGTGAVSEVWLRWTGPLGLGARQHRRELDAAMRVSPSLAAVRSPALHLFLRESEYGLVARRIRGEGTQFEALAEYQPGMDRRRIDWKTSARHTHLYAKEYETERNNQVVFAFDCGRAMCEPVAGLPRIDRAVSAALAAAYVALKGGDRVALFGFAARPELATPFVAGTRAFHRLQSAAAELDYHPQEPNFTLALATLAGRLRRRSLIVVFSEFPDPTSAELMVESISRLIAHHVVLFVTLADEELETIAADAPQDMPRLAMAVTADTLLRQRQLVTARLHQLGVEVIEAPHDRIGTRLIDAYLRIKRAGRIG
ncbi:MAG: DUF58 domain-containing protein, partial [Alphaproteobacteria bacterium]|nr:DUF58 domain-containing protein [Alphaproteobacteria bacterium]